MQNSEEKKFEVILSFVNLIIRNFSNILIFEKKISIQT